MMVKRWLYFFLLKIENRSMEAYMFFFGCGENFREKNKIFKNYHQQTAAVAAVVASKMDGGKYICHVLLLLTHQQQQQVTLRSLGK